MIVIEKFTIKISNPNAPNFSYFFTFCSLCSHFYSVNSWYPKNGNSIKLSSNQDDGAKMVKFQKNLFLQKEVAPVWEKRLNEDGLSARQGQLNLAY